MKDVVQLNRATQKPIHQPFRISLVTIVGAGIIVLVQLWLLDQAFRAMEPTTVGILAKADRHYNVCVEERPPRRTRCA